MFLEASVAARRGKKLASWTAEGSDQVLIHLSHTQNPGDWRVKNNASHKWVWISSFCVLDMVLGIDHFDIDRF